MWLSSNVSVGCFRCANLSAEANIDISSSVFSSRYWAAEPIVIHVPPRRRNREAANTNRLSSFPLLQADLGAEGREEYIAASQEFLKICWVGEARSSLTYDAYIVLVFLSKFSNETSDTVVNVAHNLDK
jgi:hypothetical protein